MQFIRETALKFGRAPPLGYVARMCRSNGGGVSVGADSSTLCPILDTSDRKRLARTCNDIIRETASARQRLDFPTDALAIGDSGPRKENDHDSEGQVEREGGRPGLLFKLVTAFPLASIKSHEQLQAAQSVLDQFLGQGELQVGEEMYLGLSDLVAAYEDEHHAIELPSDADMLRHLMEEVCDTVATESRSAVPKSMISEYLQGRRTAAAG
jgi:antitoxin component HigA of HigAB toxin-antitoxin module